MARKPKKAAAKEPGEGEQPASGGSKKKMIIIAAAAVLVLGGGFGAYKMMSHGGEGAHGEEGAAHAEAEPAIPEHKVASFVDLPEMTVNLDSKERAQYLKVKIALEVPEAKMSEEIAPVMPRVLDAFQSYMRQLRPTDLEGSAGLYRLKEELTKRVNIAVSPARVDAVLFKEIVVQ